MKANNQNKPLPWSKRKGKGMHKLTPQQVESVTTPGLHRVDKSLYLSVRPSGSRAWIQRLRVNGKQTDFGLGPYPEVSIAEAKAKALAKRAEMYHMKSQGGFPAFMPPSAPAPVQVEDSVSTGITFRKAMMDYLEIHGPTYKNEKDVKAFRSKLETYAKRLLPMHVQVITKKDVLDVLLPIWNDKRPTARCVRQHIRAVLSYCESQEYVGSNVAGEGINGALPKNGYKASNRESLDYKLAPDAVNTIKTAVQSTPVRLALLLLIHTGTRSSEAKNARWDEIDFENALWTVPEDRMGKTKVPHDVPLSSGAVEILEQAKALDNGSGLIFPSELTGKVMSKDRLNEVWKEIRSDNSTCHGFRSTLRTWVGDKTDHDWTTAEKALSHTVGNSVARAYDRAKQLDKVRAMFQDWSDYLTS